MESWVEKCRRQEPTRNRTMPCPARSLSGYSIPRLLGKQRIAVPKASRGSTRLVWVMLRRKLVRCPPAVRSVAAAEIF